MNGLFEDATDKPRATVASRLVGWLELLPFRRGVTLIAVLIIVPAFIIGGLFAIRGGGHGDPSRSRAAAATPSVRAHNDSGTVEQTERAFGEIVASRSVHPTARSSATASPSRPPTHGTTSRTRPTPSTRPSPSASTRCPPELKKWPWMWDLCKRRRGGHTTP